MQAIQHPVYLYKCFCIGGPSCCQTLKDDFPADVTKANFPLQNTPSIRGIYVVLFRSLFTNLFFRGYHINKVIPKCAQGCQNVSSFVRVVSVKRLLRSLPIAYVVISELGEKTGECIRETYRKLNSALLTLFLSVRITFPPSERAYHLHFSEDAG